MASDKEEFSGSDSDSGFDNDMEALRRACHLTGTDPLDLHPPTSHFAAYESEDDDFELVRTIQRRFSDTTDDIEEPLSMKPLCSLPPIVSDNDYEDDFETLRAIQRRFSQYNDSVNDNMEGSFQKHEQVGATNIDLEKESSNNMFLEKTNNGQGFPDCVDASATSQNLNSSCDVILETQPSDLIEWKESGGENIAVSPVKDSVFPKSAQAFVDAIKKNRLCQKFIRNKLIQIEARIEENRKLRGRVKILKDFQVACRKRTGQALSQKKDARIQLISVPKLRANSKVNDKKLPAIYHGPAENPHVANCRLVLSKYPLSLNREKWSKEEKENVAKGIKQQFQEMLLQKSMDLLSGADGDSNALDSMVASIRDHEITPENIRSFVPKVNWEQLASMYITGRTGAECEARWLNCEDPLINHQPWSKLEDKNLLHIVQQRGISNWIEIAVLMGTNRTPFQCLARYQRSLNASILKRGWTEDDDGKLRAAVAAFGESNWQLVASRLEGRTGTQCSNRWKKSLHPIRQRVGKWTSDEDKHLKIAVMLFGAKNWNKIAQFVPGRTQVQCRERWVNCLDPSLNLNEWTEEEDSRLKAAIEEHGHSWSRIAACIPPRTDSQCRRRWKVLLPHEVPLLRAARNMQKAALISNFVDREEERPALGPNDFIAPLMIETIPEFNRGNHSKRKKRKLRSMPEDNENDSASGRIHKIRRKGPRKESRIGADEVLRLTNGEEVENVGGDVARKKRVKNKPRSKNNKPTTLSQDILLPYPGAFDNAKIKKTATGRRKRKSRGWGELLEKYASSELDAISKQDKVNVTSESTFIEVAESGLQEVQMISELDEVEASGADGVMLMGGNKGTDPIQDNSSSPLLSTASVENVVVEVIKNSNIMYTRELVSRSPSLPLSGDNTEERPPRCSAPDIMDGLNSRPSGGVRPNRLKNNSSFRGRARSKQMEEIKDEEDMTLASFIQQSGKHHGRSTNSSGASASTESMPKRSRVEKRSGKSQISEIQEEDGITLAFFCSELKKRRLELRKDGRVS